MRLQVKSMSIEVFLLMNNDSTALADEEFV